MIDAAQQRISALEKKVGPDAKSPLFAQLAYYYLETKRAQDALRVCDAGLANFPFYTTGHLIKGKALAALNMRAEARREFEFVLDFLPNNETIKTLLAQMPQSEEKSISTTLQEARSEIGASIQTPPASSSYTIPSALSAESGYSKSKQLTPKPEPSLSDEPSSESTFFDAIIQTQSAGTVEDAFGFGLETPATETPVTWEPSPFSGFDVPLAEPSPFPETPEPSIEQKGGFNLQSSDQIFSTSPKRSEEESFENYASRRRAELSNENTISLEDYFNNIVSAPQQELTLPTVAPISSGVQNKIEELAGKLQTAGKITPVINFAQKETPPASEQDTPVGMGFVTPTLAEIYAKQGWYDDAIKAYKTLARNKPAEKERFEKRIAELEEMKKQSGG